MRITFLSSTLSDLHHPVAIVYLRGMNVDIFQVLIVALAGGGIAWILSAQVRKSSLNDLKTLMAVESEKLRITNDTLSHTQDALVQRTRELQQANEDLSMHKARLENAVDTFRKQEETIAQLRQELSEKSENLTQTFGKNQELSAQNEALAERMRDLRKEIDESRKTFEAEFKNVAQSILDEKTQKFTELNKANLDSILKPLSENIENFRKKVEETYDKESKERFSLADRVKELKELNERISKEAGDLTRALKGDTKKQGNWGEVILERILEKSGLQKGREYSTQESYRDADGNLLRPDVVLSYPDNRKVVIDSKVSLIAYEKYANAEDPDQQEQYLREHIRSLRNHIDQLSQKKYEELVQSLDFTMMFIPVEPAYLEAVRTDDELWHYAYNKRILLISPTHLVSAIKMIADLWKRDAQNRNAEEIARRGGMLYDKFVGFYENMERIGKNIQQAGNAYDDAVKQLSTGKGNLVSQAEQLRRLGLKTTKDLPGSAIESNPELD